MPEVSTQKTLDDGFLSRKWLLILFTQTLMFVAALLAHRWGAISALYPALVGGLLGAAGMYFGANLGHRFINNQIPGADDAGDPPTQAK